MLFALPPATALGGRKRLPPVYAPPAPVYLLHGTLTHYVPAAGAFDGEITIHVTRSTLAASFALYRTLTFRVTVATPVLLDGDGRIDDGELGWVRVVSASSVSSIDGLHALPAATVVEDRLPEQTYL